LRHGPTITRSGRIVVMADGQLRYQLAGIWLVGVAGVPEWPLASMRPGASREIVEEGQAFTAEVAR